MQTTENATQLPPPGFKGNPSDVVPLPFEWTAPDPEYGVVKVWLHNVRSDPTEQATVTWLACHPPPQNLKTGCTLLR